MFKYILSDSISNYESVKWLQVLPLIFQIYILSLVAMLNLKLEITNDLYGILYETFFYIILAVKPNIRQFI